MTVTVPVTRGGTNQAMIVIVRGAGQPDSEPANGPGHVEMASGVSTPTAAQ